MLDALRARSGQLAERVALLMMRERRSDAGNGAIGYRGPTFERRLAVVVGIADRLACQELAALSKPLFVRLSQEWASERPDIEDGVELLRRLDGFLGIGAADVADMVTFIKASLLAEARAGCRSDELGQLVGVIDIDDPCRDSDPYRRAGSLRDLSDDGVRRRSARMQVERPIRQPDRRSRAVT